MMDNKQQIVLDKGIYTHPENSALIRLKEYIIVKEKDKRCLLLRFANESDIVATGMDVSITPIRADGTRGKSIDVQLDGFRIAPGETLAPPSGIIIDDDLVDFTISIERIYSSDYFYREVDGIVNAKYVPPSSVVHSNKGKNHFSVKRKRESRCRLAAIAAVIGLIAFMAIMFYMSMRRLGHFDALFSAIALLR